MRKMFLIFSAVLVVAGFLGIQKYLGAKEDAEKAPKYTIKQVMKLAHNRKKGLVTKIADGSASKDDKEQLLTLYLSLSQQKPPKGSVDDWKQRCAAIVKAAKGVVADKDGSVDSLKKAINCMACHEKHKKDDDND
jgi:hypothetical protein